MRAFGCIEDRGNGKWLCRWSDVRGARKTHMVTGTHREAELFLARMEMERDGADRSVTYGDYWQSFVLPQIGKLEGKTQYEYQRLWERHLQPAIGSRKVSSTTYRFAQSVIDSIEAPSQQRKAAALWRKICNMAVRDGIMGFCPISRMEYKPLKRREKSILPASDVLQFAMRARESKYAHLVVLELCAGLRHEEACAVRAEDVGEMDGCAIVSVTKARVLVNGKMVEKDVKNAVSARCVPLAGVCAEMLMDCEVQPVNPESASRNWKAWNERRGRPYVPFGDMRSNFATHAGECCDGALVDVYMGHSGSTTMDKWYRARTDAGMQMVAEAYADYVSSTSR